jgi:hypothetical protein
VNLPPLVRQYLEQALPDGPQGPDGVRITQEGTMWVRPGVRCRPFTASEHFAIERVAFSWRARFPVVGRIAFDVVDAYDEGQGLLELRALGLRVSRQSGPELAFGESQRYLAELPWVPHAIGRNAEIHWLEVEDGNVEVSAEVLGRRAGVTFTFDADGDIVEASALRPRQVGKTSVETPWGGTFSEYEVVDGIRLPGVAEVYWEIDGNRFVYWRGRVLSASAR